MARRRPRSVLMATTSRTRQPRSVYRKSGGSWSLSSLGGSAGGVYVVGAKKEAVPTGSEVLIYHSFPGTATYTLAASAANSRCTARTAATAQTDFDLQKNGASIGTIRFAAAGTVASYVGVAGTTFTGGADDVRVVAPASPDVSIAGLSFALYLTR
jgi:hypothetical protein